MMEYNRSPELEANLEQKGKYEQLVMVKNLSRLARIHSICAPTDYRYCRLYKFQRFRYPRSGPRRSNQVYAGMFEEKRYDAECLESLYINRKLKELGLNEKRVRQWERQKKALSS